jgi:uncharacterized membrane protein YbhN (UPF0104 family)
MKKTELPSLSGHWLAKWWIRTLLYLVAAALFIWLLWRSDSQRVWAHLVSVDGWRVTAATALLSIVTLIGAANVYLFVGRDRKLSFKQFLPIYWSSWAFGLLVPGQVGDIASLSWLLRRYSLPASVSLGRATLDKLISAAIMLTIAMAGLALLIASQTYRVRLLQSVAVLIVVMLTAVAAVYIQRKQIAATAERPGFAGALVRSLYELARTANSSPMLLMLNIVLTLMKVLMTGMAYWVVLHGLGAPRLGLIEVTVIATAAGLIAYLPVSVNGLGTVEVTGLFLFGQAGAPAETVLAAYILLRGLVLLVAWAPLPMWFLFSQVSSKHAK